MRLTPSWLRSSPEASDEEHADDALSSPTTVPIYHNPTGATAQSATADTQAGASDFVPEADATLLAVLEEVQTPVTVDTVVDEVIEPANPSIDTWARVHERLYRDRLPALDESGEIDFDPDRGIVELNRAEAAGGRRFPRSIFGVFSAGLLVVIVLAWMTSVLTALTFTVVIVTLVVWFVPISGIV